MNKRMVVAKLDNNNNELINLERSLRNSNIPLLKIPYCKDNMAKTPNIDSHE